MVRFNYLSRVFGYSFSMDWSFWYLAFNALHTEGGWGNVLFQPSLFTAFDASYLLIWQLLEERAGRRQPGPDSEWLDFVRIE